MKALLFDYDERLKLKTDYPEPQLALGEAIIKVSRAGICNTDLEITRGYLDFHGVLGHEFVGVVQEVSTSSEKDWLGKRVVGDINAACYRCETCLSGRHTHCPNRTTLGIFGRDGAFAEYLRLPVANLFVVADSIPDEMAVFTEPLAAACQILYQLHVRPTDKVAVIGDGKLGLLVAQVLRLSGADLTVLGRHSEKGQIVARQGVRYIKPEEGKDIREQVGGECDLVVECTGNEVGLAMAKALVRPRGTIVLKSTYHGTPAVPMSLYVVDEITLLGSRCGPFDAALRLMERKLVDLNSMVSFEFPLIEGMRAFEHAFGHSSLKVLLNI
ncbi:MAG: alcohol dehydrogenase catalytic domain-containing protein [Chloroflexi bacterium]|uniref:Alcohol dehydrogenase catalytic domain-containing protein n=1 Tax=Candidatus Chlorohelix allophototropha TaxID=3003348 RepID=A0A8T7LYA1_9CHLR|nr:alcohol dehydrogenase catalytic domain-containing protein [Chloroflexota bacterium]WJW67148.1 alcohol dehydrogenase catalytic domain-containing protein [Chloroflexota bacterium L227-S17]